MNRRPQLHVLTASPATGALSRLEIIRAALAAGADVIQLRDKEADAREVAALLERVLPLVRAAGGLVLVNDHWEVARAGGADGVHVGPGDAPARLIRRACPRPFRIGVSARTADAARDAVAAGADYLGVGPVFGTTSKPGAPPAVGTGTIGELAAAVPIPVIGIGGIDSDNAADVIRAGGAGVAVLSSVSRSADPEAAARAVRTAIDASAAPLAGSDPGC